MDLLACSKALRGKAGYLVFAYAAIYLRVVRTY